MEKCDNRVEQIALMTMQGMTQSSIAKSMGITRQRIGQLLDKAERFGISTRRRQLKTKSCFVCGSEFHKKHPWVGKFCSLECKNQIRRKFGGPSSSIQVQIIVCSGCGAKFSRTNRMIYICGKAAERRGTTPKRKFCTKECYFKNGVKK